MSAAPSLLNPSGGSAAESPSAASSSVSPTPPLPPPTPSPFPSTYSHSLSATRGETDAATECYKDSLEAHGRQFDMRDTASHSRSRPPVTPCDSSLPPISSSSSSPSSSFYSLFLSSSCVDCGVRVCCVTPRRRCWVAGVVVCCLLLLAAGVSVGVLYPRPPSIVAHSLRLIQLTVDLSPNTAAAATTTTTVDTATTAAAVNVSALLSVDFTLHNPNAYSAHHHASLVSFFSLPPSAPLIGHFTLPAGFISSRATEDVSSAVSVTTSISSPAQLQQWQVGGMQVAAAADTSGYVDFLFGLPVHFTVRTRCSAALTLDMRTSAVDVSQQQCSNGL